MGLAKSKTDAVRMGIFALNKEYRLVKDFEMELVAKKLQQEESQMKRKRQTYSSEEKALAKYRK